MTLKNILMTAIDKAVLPGKCKYVVNGAPCCVIGQLAHLEGISIERMQQWDSNLQENSVKDIDAEELYKYSLSLLEKLQMMWDENLEEGETEFDKKEKMKEVVSES